jgi:hypothetical protein
MFITDDDLRGLIHTALANGKTPQPVNAGRGLFLGGCTSERALELNPY